MKTDRFTDIIRRKLESIRPEFTDEDWVRMQSTLKDANLSQPNAPGTHHPFPGGVWSGQPWLLAAAAISTVVLVTLSIWQRREINQLRQTVEQLHPSTVQQPAPAPSSIEAKEQRHSDVAQSAQSSGTPQVESQEATSLVNRNANRAAHPDTVYVTRYVAVPSRTKSQPRLEDRLSQQQALPVDQQPVAEMSDTPSIARQPVNLPNNQQTESYDASSTSPVASNSYGESTLVTRSNRPLAKQKSLLSQNTGTSVVKRRRSSASNSVTDKNDPADDNAVAQSEPSVAVNAPSADYERVTSRPLTLPKKNWSVSLAQRARRMQPATAAAEPASIPASQPVKSMAARFRAGVSGEIASHLWSAGVYTELLIGKHLTVGVGLNQATSLNQFMTEDDFNGRTQRDFRREYARGINAWGDIQDIDTRQVRLQLPVSLGYRIPFNQSLALLTSVGTSLNLASAENVTYYCRPPLFPPMPPQPRGGFREVEVAKSQPIALINSFSLGVGIEWQRSHWIVQATPVLTIPVQNSQDARQTDLNWQQNVTAGLRARLLYQF